MTSPSLSFLQSVAGFVEGQRTSSADRPCLLGTVDPAYAGLPSLPKITFDGESTLSGKAYPHLSTYVPVPGDRVALVPIGNTYLIVGPIAATAAAVALQGGSLTVDDATVAGHSVPRGVVGGKYFTGTDRAVGVTNTELVVNMDTGSVSLTGGRLYRVLVKFSSLGSVANDTWIFRLRDTNVSGTQRGEFVWTVQNSSFGYSHPLLAFRYMPAADETKTFAWTAQRIGGTGTLNINTGGSANSAYMIVEDIGLASALTLVS